MRGLGGGPRVGELARVGIPAEQVRGGGRVVEERRPEALVVGEHAAAEDEGVDRRQQLEAVSPGVDPVDLVRGAEDASVERHLHGGDQSSRGRGAHGCLLGEGEEVQPMVAYRAGLRNHWLRVVAMLAPTKGRRPQVVPDRISREVVIDAPPDRVWAIVTEPRHVARWFSDEAEIDLRPGGAMVLTWHGHGTYRGRVEAVEPPHRFAFRWLRREDNEPGDGTSTLVEFVLAAEGLGHAATRRRERLPAAGLARGGQGPLRRRERRRLGPRVRPAPRLRGRPRQPRRFMTGEGEDADQLWAAIADPTRQRLLDLLLTSGDATATALARDLPITRQGIAKHLAVLAARRTRRGNPHRTRGQIHRPRRPPRPGHPADGADPRQVGRPPRRDQAHRRDRARLPTLTPHRMRGWDDREITQSM